MSSAQPMHLNCGAMQPGGPTDAVGSVAAATSSGRTSAAPRARRQPRARIRRRRGCGLPAVGYRRECQYASTSLLQPYRSIKSWYAGTGTAVG